MGYQHSNSLPSDQLARKIRDMASSYELEDIATMAKVDYATVQAIVGPQRRDYWLRCNKTGRQWRKATWRGVYRVVCLFGLTDWDFGRGEVAA